jgi:hypothetical protein
MPHILYNQGVEKYLEWAGRRWKRLAVVGGLCVVVLLAALYHFVWNKDPVGDAVRGMFSAVGDNHLGEALGYVDPDSELARYWNSNQDGIQDRTRKALAEYKVGFDLELEVVTSGEEAQARLTDGTMKIGSRDPGAQGAFPISLKSLGLVFYLEKKGGRWLITGINYEDLGQLADELSY